MSQRKPLCFETLIHVPLFIGLLCRGAVHGFHVRHLFHCLFDSDKGLPITHFCDKRPVQLIIRSLILRCHFSSGPR